LSDLHVLRQREHWSSQDVFPDGQLRFASPVPALGGAVMRLSAATPADSAFRRARPQILLSLVQAVGRQLPSAEGKHRCHLRDVE
jgi:hypothetical protein